MPERLHVFHLKIATSKIGFLKFLLEGYDNLAILSTVDQADGVITVSTTVQQVNELLSVLCSLHREYNLTQNNTND